MNSEQAFHNGCLTLNLHRILLYVMKCLQLRHNMEICSLVLMDCQIGCLVLGDVSVSTVMPWTRLEHGCVKLNQELLKFSQNQLELNQRLWRSS